MQTKLIKQYKNGRKIIAISYTVTVEIDTFIDKNLGEEVYTVKRMGEGLTHEEIIQAIDSVK